MMYIEPFVKWVGPPDISLVSSTPAGREVSHLKAMEGQSQGHLITIYFPCAWVEAITEQSDRWAILGT